MITHCKSINYSEKPIPFKYGVDGHGSVRYLTDITGAITDVYDFDAFGLTINQTGTTSNNYLYAGEQYDHDLGLYFLRARYLDVNRGRFWSQDEYEGRGVDPASLHKYLYGANDPINNIDPSGRNFIKQITAAVVHFILASRPVLLLGNFVYRAEVFLTVNYFTFLKTIDYIDKAGQVLDVSLAIGASAANIMELMADRIRVSQTVYPDDLPGQAVGFEVGSELGQNLGDQFPTIDHYENGTAISIKSTTNGDQKAFLDDLYTQAKELAALPKNLKGKDAFNNKIEIDKADVRQKGLIYVVPGVDLRWNRIEVANAIDRMAKELKIAIRVIPHPGIKARPGGQKK